MFESQRRDVLGGQASVADCHGRGVGFQRHAGCTAHGTGRTRPKGSRTVAEEAAGKNLERLPCSPMREHVDSAECQWLSWPVSEATGIPPPARPSPHRGHEQHPLGCKWEAEQIRVQWICDLITM